MIDNYSCKDLGAIYALNLKKLHEEHEDKINARLDELNLGSCVRRKSDGAIGILRFRHTEEMYPCFWPLRDDNTLDPQPCDENIESEFEPVAF